MRATPAGHYKVISVDYRMPPVATLTPKGTALGDVLLAFVRWGKQYIPGTVTLNRESATGGSAASTPSSRGARIKRPR